MKMKMRLLTMALMGFALFSSESFAQTVDSELDPTQQQLYLQALTSPTDLTDPNYVESYPFRASLRGRGLEVTELSRMIVSLPQDAIKQDPKIQKALIAIREHHPISMNRMLASRALSPAGTGGRIPFDDPRGINKNRTYCAPESVGAKPLATVPEGWLDDLTPIYDTGIEGQDFNDTEVEGVDIFAKEVSGGWLAGYSTVSNLGLHYVPHEKSLETEYLLSGTIHAMIERDGADSIMVLSSDDGNNGFGFGYDVTVGVCSGSLKLSEVKEIAEGDFEIKLHRTLPKKIKTISQMENGDLFITFGAACYVRGIESGPYEYSYNPPIGLTASGEIYDVCEKGSSRKRW